MPWRGVNFQWAEWTFWRYDDFPSEWAAVAQRPTDLVPAPLHHNSRPSQTASSFFTLLQTLYFVLILFKPLLNTLSHANSLQLIPFCIFFTLVSSPRYLPPHLFVIRAFPFTQAHPHTLSRQMLKTPFACLNPLLR